MSGRRGRHRGYRRACIGSTLGHLKSLRLGAQRGRDTAKMAHRAFCPVPHPRPQSLLGSDVFQWRAKNLLRQRARNRRDALRWVRRSRDEVSAIGTERARRPGRPRMSCAFMIGEAAERPSGFDEEIAVIEANLDDMNRRLWLLLESMSAARWTSTPRRQMKKNRPGSCSRFCASEDTTR